MPTEAIIPVSEVGDAVGRGASRVANRLVYRSIREDFTMSASRAIRLRAGTIGFASLVVFGCDRTPAITALPEPAPGFSAQLTGDGQVVSLAGSVTASTDAGATAFTGAFQAYPVATSADGNTFRFTMLTLRASTGEELVLGHVSPRSELPNGRFGIEEGRDLREPYDFVARFRDAATRGAVAGNISALGGSVTVTSSSTRLDGSFVLTLADHRTLTGTFSAATR